jgi:hypothetical protein
MLALTHRGAKPTRRTTTRSAPAALPLLAGARSLSVLGRDRALLGVQSDPVNGTELSVRHSELLFLLVRHRAGYTADQLAVALHERDVPAVTVRAELSRLRSLVPDLGMSGRPYRLTSQLSTDVDLVRKALSRGDVAGAVDAYPGPILPSSESPEVQAERDELHREVRSAVLASTTPQAVLRFANRPCSREDVLVWRHAVRLAPPSTRPVLVEHLLRIERELGGVPVRTR